MNYTVIVTQLALDRIDEQMTYIKTEAGTPLNAERWLRRVLAALDSLQTMPRRAPRSQDADCVDYELRALNVDGFLLIFTVEDNGPIVRVLTARHGRQLPISSDLPPHEGGSVSD